MASSAMASGELYFAGEVDPRTQEHTSYIKIGIVREADNRSSSDRMKEHQTGNPRELILITALLTPVVEQIETLMHGTFAPLRLSGEWFFLSPSQRDDVIQQASRYISEAEQSIADMLRAADLQTMPSLDAAIAPNDHVRDLHQRLMIVRREISTLEKATKSIDATVRDLSDQNVPLGRYATLAPPTESEKFDEATFKVEHPELWAQFVETKQSWAQRFLLTETKDMKAALGDLRSEISEISNVVNATIGLAMESRDVSPIHEEFLNILTVLAPLEWEEKRLEAQLKTEIGENREIEGICTWSRESKDRE